MSRPWRLARESCVTSLSSSSSNDATLRLPGHEVPVTVLDAGQSWRAIDPARMWRYRDLLWFLALRDVQVRYKQTALGVLWAVLQPVVTMVVLSVFLGHFAGLSEKTGGVPYPVFVYAGLLPWAFFASTVVAASNSLVANAAVLKKVYFPRLIVPLASTGAPLVDLMVSFGVLAALMAWYSIGVSVSLLLMPLMVLSVIVAAMGVGVLLSALTVSYRDFRFVVAFLVQIWFYVTPVIYPVTILPQWLRPIMWLNPMHGTIEAFRAATLSQPIDFAAWAASSAVAIACLVAGVVYFARTERCFADVA